MKDLFKNCLSVSEDDGWFTPLRFTDNQLSAYGVTDALRIRGAAPSSVCLAFRSKAKKLSLEYRITGKARNWAVFDVVCDGVMMSSVSLDADSGCVDIPLCGDDGVDTLVYLPHLVCISLRNITADAPLTPTPKKDKFWLALGDSITQGMVAKHPASAYPSVLSRQYNCEVINAGVGGVIFDAEHLDRIGREPDLITVALGANDWDRCGIDEFKQNMTAYLDKLLAIFGCRNIYGILPVWRSDCDQIKSGVNYEGFRKLITEVYRRYPSIKIIDGYKMVPHMSDYYGDPSDKKIHPNDEGFLYYSLGLFKAIQNI